MSRWKEQQWVLPCPLFWQTSSWKTLRHMPWRPPPENLSCGAGTSPMFLSSGPMEISSWRNSIFTSTNRTPSIQLTLEKESEGTIAFLDVHLERRGAGVLTSVFHNKTHTDRYLNFDSNHPTMVKRGIIQCLRHRAEKVCSAAQGGRSSDT